MRPYDPLYPGLVVWDAQGQLCRVTSVVVAVAEAHHHDDGSIDWASATIVRVVPEGAWIAREATLDTFMKQYHIRSTGWERLVLDAL